MNPGFWTVFKADLLFGACSITASVIVTILISWWRRKKADNRTRILPVQAQGPHIVVIGGAVSSPCHCPLCGKVWPLPGPILEGPSVDLSFRCPDCGGSSFGSAATTPDPAGPLQRYCHGNNAGDGRHGCKFKWPEKDDWKYFLCNGRKVETPEEYEAIMNKMRSTPIADL